MIADYDGRCKRCGEDVELGVYICHDCDDDLIDEENNRRQDIYG